MSIRVATWENWLATSLDDRTQLDPVARFAYDVLVSPRTGLISHLSETNVELENASLLIYQARTAEFSRYLPDARANWSLCRGDGMGLTRHTAILSAIGEAVERYAASLYDTRRDIVWASYHDVADSALCPTLFALPSEAERVRFPEFAVSFDPAEPIGWAQGRSLPGGRPVLAPASFVYADYRLRSPKERYGPGISTGLAAGPSWDGAVMKGLCECVERDAFTIVYLNRLPVPEINLAEIDHPMVRSLLNRIPPWRQCQIRAWNVTLDIGISTVWAAVIGQHDAVPAFACGAATHVDPLRALHKALLEAWHCWHFLLSRIQPRYRDRQFAADWHDVQSRQDHLGLACQRHYLACCDWLLSERELVSIGSLPDLSGGTLEEELERAIGAVERVGLQVAAFDLTTTDVQQAGFRVCRVLVPGVQQLMFGPIRMLGGKRLYLVPHKLGYTPEPTTEASLNPVPHPFP